MAWGGLAWPVLRAAVCALSAVSSAAVCPLPASNSGIAPRWSPVGRSRALCWQLSAAPTVLRPAPYHCSSRHSLQHSPRCRTTQDAPYGHARRYQPNRTYGRRSLASMRAAASWRKALPAQRTLCSSRCPRQLQQHDASHRAHNFTPLNCNQLISPHTLSLASLFGQPGFGCAAHTAAPQSKRRASLRSCDAVGPRQFVRLQPVYYCLHTVLVRRARGARAATCTAVAPHAIHDWPRLTPPPHACRYSLPHRTHTARSSSEPLSNCSAAA